MQCLRSRSLSGTLPFARWLIARGSCSKLFVGGLSYDTNEIVLKVAFGQYGEITEVKVICDHKSGRSKGYGFVRFTAESAASIALQKMDGQLLDGREIRNCGLMCFARWKDDMVKSDQLLENLYQ
ncbi:hypothetical protein NE237_001565 [Protea cynaroides]|uniref:RRM domain-containing protein n=1 Tax=Protea cynaroides TaxID=273540 RepID=A0A9Q0KTR4_9MAGN|nr:hypothetical protein NE237_001565 [Protea cynaroides]